MNNIFHNSGHVCKNRKQILPENNGDHIDETDRVTLASDVWLGQSGRPWTGASSHVDWPLHTAAARESLQAKGDIKLYRWFGIVSRNTDIFTTGDMIIGLRPVHRGNLFPIYHKPTSSCNTENIVTIHIAKSELAPLLVTSDLNIDGAANQQAPCCHWICIS